MNLLRLFSPRLFNREAVDSQHPPQCILGAVDDVLLLLVVQLLLHDVLTEVKHHLQEKNIRNALWGDMQTPDSSHHAKQAE